MIFKKYKNDMMLILALLVTAGCIWCMRQTLRKQGGEVQISVSGTVVTVLPLNKDTEFVLSGKNSVFEAGSDFENTVVISDGRVCVRNANCPDKICEHCGWISYNGESIVCLPHKLVVTVEDTADRVDAIVR